MAFKQFENSLKYISNSLTIQNYDSEHYTLKGWILLQLNEISKQDSIHTLFQKALQLNPKNLEGIIGISELYLRNDNLTEALNIIS